MVENIKYKDVNGGKIKKKFEMKVNGRSYIVLWLSNIFLNDKISRGKKYYFENISWRISAILELI